MSLNKNLNNNINNRNKKWRKRRVDLGLESLSVGMYGSYGKIVKSSLGGGLGGGLGGLGGWCENYVRESNKEYVVLNEVMNIRMVCIDLKNDIEKYLRKYDKRGLVRNKGNVENNNELKCKICFNNKIDVLCSPCNHVCICSNCSSRIKECPMCRKQIKKFDKIYIS